MFELRIDNLYIYLSYICSDGSHNMAGIGKRLGKLFMKERDFDDLELQRLKYHRPQFTVIYSWRCFLSGKYWWGTVVIRKIMQRLQHSLGWTRGFICTSWTLSFVEKEARATYQTLSESIASKIVSCRILFWTTWRMWKGNWNCWRCNNVTSSSKNPCDFYDVKGIWAAVRGGGIWHWEGVIHQCLSYIVSLQQHFIIDIFLHLVQLSL